jgi:hypothetical protein
VRHNERRGGKSAGSGATVLASVFNPASGSADHYYIAYWHFSFGAPQRLIIHPRGRAVN